MSQEKPLTEKGPTLFIPTDALMSETKPQNKCCTRSVVSKVLALLLMALMVTLFIEFLFPVINRRYRTSVIDVIEVYGDVKPPPDGNVVPEEPWPLDFLINPTGLCGSSPEGVKLLVLVPSATDHFDQRDAIRKTWGSLANKGTAVRLGFVLGHANASESLRVAAESARFGDIIQGELEDKRNRTAKSVLLLRWAAAHCPHAHYVLKTEDDTFVNMEVVEEVMAKEPFAPGGTFIGGFIHNGESDSSPPYVSGSSYLTTGSTASRLFEASRRVRPPLLPQDDLYVTGLCAQNIAARLVHEPCFRDAPLHSSWDSLSSLATIRTDFPDDMDKLWDEMTKTVSEESTDSSTENQQALFDVFNWADQLLEDIGYSEETDESSAEEDDPMEEMIDNFFDWPAEESSNPGQSVGGIDLNSVISNFLTKNNRLGFDDSTSNGAISKLQGIPDRQIIIGSISSRMMLPNFGGKNEGGLSPIQRLMMGLTSPKSEDGVVDQKQIMTSNSLSSLLSPRLGYNNNMNPFNMRQNGFRQSSVQSSGFEANNMDSTKVIQTQSKLTGGVHSEFRASGSENVMGSPGIQRDLPDWPGSQSGSGQFQTLRFNMPIRWQRTYVIPLTSDQSRGMNTTNYVPQ